MPNIKGKQYVVNGGPTIVYFDEKINTPQLRGNTEKVEELCEKFYKYDDTCSTKRLAELKFYLVEFNRDADNSNDKTDMKDHKEKVENHLLPAIIHIHSHIEMSHVLQIIDLMRNYLQDNPVLRDIIFNIIKTRQITTLKYKENEYKDTYLLELKTWNFFGKFKNKSKTIEKLFSLLDKKLLSVPNRDLEIGYYNCKDRCLKEILEKKNVKGTLPKELVDALHSVNVCYLNYTMDPRFQDTCTFSWRFDGNLVTKLKELRYYYRDMVLGRILELFEEGNAIPYSIRQRCFEIVQVLEGGNPLIYTIIHNLFNGIYPFANMQNFREFIPKAYEYFRKIEAKCSLANDMFDVANQIH